jgi:hypothetical protein
MFLQKGKEKIHGQTKKQVFVFQNGCDKWEAKCLLNKPGTCM